MEMSTSGSKNLMACSSHSNLHRPVSRVCPCASCRLSYWMVAQHTVKLQIKWSLSFEKVFIISMNLLMEKQTMTATTASPITHAKTNNNVNKPIMIKIVIKNNWWLINKKLTWMKKKQLSANPKQSQCWKLDKISWAKTRITLSGAFTMHWMFNLLPVFCRGKTSSSWRIRSVRSSR